MGFPENFSLSRLVLQNPTRIDAKNKKKHCSASYDNIFAFYLFYARPENAISVLFFENFGHSIHGIAGASFWVMRGRPYDFTTKSSELRGPKHFPFHGFFQTTNMSYRILQDITGYLKRESWQWLQCIFLFLEAFLQLGMSKGSLFFPSMWIIFNFFFEMSQLEVENQLKKSFLTL